MKIELSNFDIKTQYYITQNIKDFNATLLLLKHSYYVTTTYPSVKLKINLLGFHIFNQNSTLPLCEYPYLRKKRDIMAISKENSQIEKRGI